MRVFFNKKKKEYNGRVEHSGRYKTGNRLQQRLDEEDSTPVSTRLCARRNGDMGFRNRLRQRGWYGATAVQGTTVARDVAYECLDHNHAVQLHRLPGAEDHSGLGHRGL
jgi:hypothetical protein